jgi:hypothetical protein
MAAAATLRDDVIPVMTRVEIDGQKGRLLEYKGTNAFVVFDDGTASRWCPVDKLRRLKPTGRPTGTAKVPIERPVNETGQRVFADVIAEEMERQNLTWLEIVHRSGVSRSSLARLIANNGEAARLDTIEAVAKAIGISPARFWTIERAAANAG